VVIKKSSRVSSEQLVESLTLQGRMIRWRYEFRCGMLTSGQLREESPLLRFVTRKRVVAAVID
jgi:hypothetical protein